MAITTIFQHDIVQNFILPFLLVFVLVFAILEKTKVLGDKKQLHAIIAFVVGLIFVSAVFPKEVVSNLMLFLTLALVIMFVILLLWGFVYGDKDGFKLEGWMKMSLALILGVATIAAVVWAVGVRGGVIDFLFGQSWSSTFWTNFIFVIIVVMILVYFIRDKVNK